MYMNDIKIFAQNKKELETLIQTVRIYSQDIVMKFDIEKCELENKKTNNHAQGIASQRWCWHTLCVKKRGGKRLASTEDSLDTSIHLLEDYIEKRGGRLIKSTRNNTNDMRTSGTTITRKQKWEEKQLYRRFKRLRSDISH